MESSDGFSGPFAFRMASLQGYGLTPAGRRLTLWHDPAQVARVRNFYDRRGNLRIHVIGTGHVFVRKGSVGKAAVGLGWATVEVESDAIGCVVRLKNSDPEKTLVQAIPWDRKRKVSTFVSAAIRQMCETARAAKSDARRYWSESRGALCLFTRVNLA